MFQLNVFHDKLASLTFFDPACGSGNFLTESYRCLRRLENKIIAAKLDISNKYPSYTQYKLPANPIRVTLQQFHGIELHGFAVSVCRIGLWIAEDQMVQETEAIVGHPLTFLPLSAVPNIHEGNALLLDWGGICSQFSYIFGNPPFLGKGKATHLDLAQVFEFRDGYKSLDYVCGWFKKIADFIQGTDTKCALLSTRSITCGEQVSILFPLLNELGIQIDFAQLPHKWDNKAFKSAEVYCVTIGFSYGHTSDLKPIYDSDGNFLRYAEHINGYLIDGPEIYVKPETNSLCDVSLMLNGCKPADKGYLMLNQKRIGLFAKNSPPGVMKYIRPIMGSREFLNNQVRYVLWLVGADPQDLLRYPLICERIDKVADYRVHSEKSDTRKCANTPTLLQEIRLPNADYLAVPRTSSSDRLYIPMGFSSRKM